MTSNLNTVPSEVNYMMSMSSRSSSCAFFALFLLVLLVSLVSLATLSFSQPLQKATVKEEEKEIEAGKAIYQKRCQPCHGSEGRGDGPVADSLDPKPRDFVSAQFKIRSTRFGELPTDEDLFNVISKGLANTAMEGWEEVLTAQQRWQLVAYIKSFSKRFLEESPQLIPIGKPIKITSKTISNGKELYKKMKCFLCHGDEGKGDGLITVTLNTEWNFPFSARNLTKGWLFKGGHSLKDIYRTISTGMNGTPMGSYANYLSEEERWSLASYVYSLSPDEVIEPSVVLKVRRLKDKEEIPEDFNAPQWKKAEAVEIPLSGQVIVRPRLINPSIDSITVKSLYNREEIAFLLEWDDATNRQDGIFQDQVAIQFPAKFSAGEGLDKPYFFLGQPGKPVALWRWKAKWNEESEEFEESEESEESGKSGKSEELEASGFRNVTLRVSEGQRVKAIKAKGEWHNGRWRVILKRVLMTEDKKDKDKGVFFRHGEFIPVAFYVWNGSNAEIGRRCSISSWYYLLLENPRPFKFYLYAFIGIMTVVNLELWLIYKVRISRAT